MWSYPVNSTLSTFLPYHQVLKLARNLFHTDSRLLLNEVPALPTIAGKSQFYDRVEITQCSVIV